jgi:phosphoglycerol transferase
MEGSRPWLNRVKALATYTFALLLSLCILTVTLKLWHADLTIPFAYSGDALTAQLWIKGILENGWYLHNDAVGAPFGQDMHDYPLADSFHFFLIKILGVLFSNEGEIYNIYFLLTFPLTTLSSLFVLRRLALPYAPAVVVSLLFTFLPYHFLRGLVGHLFLAAYFLVPLVVLLALWIYLDQPFLFQHHPGRRLPQLSLGNSNSLLALLVCIVLSSAGVYYALFACFIWFSAGVISFGHRRSLASLGTSLMLIAFVGAGIVANAVPSVLYRWRHGSNTEAVQRTLMGVEVYSLKITQLLLPTSVHRIPLFAKVKRYYNSFSPLGTGDYWYLGLVGIAGFFALIGWLVYRNRKTSAPGLLDGLSVLNLAALLLATAGGLGSVLSIAFGSWIRCYERMSIYIAYFSLCAVAIMLQKVAAKYVKSIASAGLYGGFLVCILVLGIWDQTSRHFIPSYAWLQEETKNDADFVSKIEASVPPHAMIFQLPYVPFPEVPPVHRMNGYDHLRGYLHSRTLRWSYGAMKGREGDAWQQFVTSQPVEQMVKTLAQSDFAGIYLDRYGFADQGSELESKLIYLLDSKPLVSANQRLAFFSLAAYKKKLPQDSASIESGCSPAGSSLVGR